MELGHNITLKKLFKQFVLMHCVDYFIIINYNKYNFIYSLIKACTCRLIFGSGH